MDNIIANMRLLFHGSCSYEANREALTAAEQRVVLNEPKELAAPRMLERWRGPKCADMISQHSRQNDSRDLMVTWMSERWWGSRGAIITLDSVYVHVYEDSGDTGGGEMS